MPGYFRIPSRLAYILMAEPRVRRLAAALAGCGALLTVAVAAGSAIASAGGGASHNPSTGSNGPHAVDVPAGVTAGIAVFDRQTGSFTEQRDITARFRSASVVKILIALDYLWDRGPEYRIPAADQNRFDLMLRSSDDAAASDLWQRGGRAQIITRMVARLGLQQTAPP